MCPFSRSTCSQYFLTDDVYERVIVGLVAIPVIKKISMMKGELWYFILIANLY